MLSRQSYWYRAYRDRLDHDANPLAPGWRVVLTTLGTVYLHLGHSDVQSERPSMIDEETGAIRVEGIIVEETSEDPCSARSFVHEIPSK